MGLDMYLERAPRFKNTTAREVVVLDEYFNYQNSESAKDCTFKEWCGFDDDEMPSQDVQDFYKKYYTLKYYHWDDNHEYGHQKIMESVGYWRKANAVHKYFVDAVQDGEDDCDYYEVSQDVLEDLLEICKTIKQTCKLVDGKVNAGWHIVDGKQETIYEDGKYIENPEIAESLLPTQSGFFFGGTDYDEWYMDDIDNTINIVSKVLAETDFNNEMIVYSSSW